MQAEAYGVVLIMHVANSAETVKILEKLSLGAAGLMESKFGPLDPFGPLSMLMGIA